MAIRSNGFTKEDIRRVYQEVKQSDEFNPANSKDSHGTYRVVNGRGAKLIVSPLGVKYEVAWWIVNDFVDSPCIWMEEGELGRWAGLQGGWPATQEELAEEEEWKSVLKQCLNTINQPQELQLMNEFMWEERYRCTAVPRVGWIARAKERHAYYKRLKRFMPGFLAAKIARRRRL